MAEEREHRVSIGVAPCGGLLPKVRSNGQFLRGREQAENFGRRGVGGGRGTGIQRSPAQVVLQLCPLLTAADMPLHWLRSESW
jgi:hypothetical protein